MNMNIRSIRGLAAICCSILVCASANIVHAVVIEGFESTLLVQGSNAKGDASIQGVYFGINPTELSKQLLLTTIGQADVGAGYGSQSGSNAVPVNGTSGLAAFLGISTGTINNGVGVNGTEGSAFKESFSLSAGDTLSFNYDFLTQEPSSGGAKDFAFVVLLDSMGNIVQYSVFSNYAAATMGTTGVGNPFCNETGYQTFQLSPLANSGTYTLGFGVVDTGNAATDTNPSGLLVDNIQVTPVPEPTTIAFSIAGAVLLVALRSRIKKTA